ncbi:hypothetical protein VCR17J2_690037 [Vibrio coralliirubri]|nr:hypothetical protein VCR17J2_690037 [Vibrio coralliirubri]
MSGFFVLRAIKLLTRPLVRGCILIELGLGGMKKEQKRRFNVIVKASLVLTLSMT